MQITDIKGRVKLNNGVEMPYLGLGVFRTNDGVEVENAVSWALEAGYRHIDTAAIYGNERGVGNAVKKSGLNREEIFITTKVWNDDQRSGEVVKAFENSLRRLQTEYIDLYLVHWPVNGKFIQTWKIFEQLYRTGKIKAIGVSNFLQHHLEDLLEIATIIPAVNQMECHPFLVQQDLQNFCQEKGIRYEAWSPIMKGKVDEVSLLIELANKYGKNPAQIALRWELQKGIVTIPKSVHKERITANGDLFDFNIEKSDMLKIDGLDKDERFGAHPDTFTF